jgi:hypothetical protein
MYVEGHLSPDKNPCDVVGNRYERIRPRGSSYHGIFQNSTIRKLHIYIIRRTRPSFYPGYLPTSKVSRCMMNDRNALPSKPRCLQHRLLYSFPHVFLSAQLDPFRSTLVDPWE